MLTRQPSGQHLLAGIKASALQQGKIRMEWTYEKGGIGPTVQGPIMPRFSLAGRFALVTGGSRGIGRAIALGLAEAGAQVAVLCRDRLDRAEEVVAELKALGREESFAAIADVADEAAVEAVMALAVERWGQLDILVANAGIGVGGPLEHMSTADWKRQMEVNVDGVFYSVRAAARHMIPRKRGNIIVTSSIAGGTMIVGPQLAAYNASKAAVTTLTKCMADEWSQYSIRVNAIAPGLVLTDIQDHLMRREPSEIYDFAMNPSPMKRMGTPDEIAGPAVFLASDASSFITGQTLVVDGGYTLTPYG